MVRLWPLVLGLALALAGLAHAEGGEAPPRWSSLNPAQRSALAPLERDWSTIDATRKQKWLDIAKRFPAMSADERARVQQRMTTWARMSPQERGQARLQYQQARQISPQERQERWQSYQALPPGEKQELARQRPAPARKAAAPTRKANEVPNSSFGAPARAVAPTVVQARPGASTTLVTRPAKPPVHQQTGLPKIGATPGFVDTTTLLPKRGPQAAAQPASAGR